MCLNNKYNNKRKQEFVKDIPKEGLKVYKVVRVNQAGEFSAPCFGVDYQYGINVIPGKYDIEFGELKYKAGFHFFESEKQAEEMLNWCHKNASYEYELVECIVKKSWITDVGQEHSWEDNHLPEEERQQITIIVANKVMFPDKKTD